MRQIRVIIQVFVVTKIKYIRLFAFSFQTDFLKFSSQTRFKRLQHGPNQSGKTVKKL